MATGEQMKIVLFVFVSFLLLRPLHAEPLSEEAIRNAKRIVIMPGTFDPVTSGHIGLAQLPIQLGLADMTILTIGENPTKNPAPRVRRLAFLEKAAKNIKSVFYPEEGTELYNTFRDKSFFGIVKKIREINPNAQILCLAGNDVAAKLWSSTLFQISIRPSEWLIALRKGYEAESLSLLFKVMSHEIISPDLPKISSSMVKNVLADHPEYYANPEENRSAIPGIAPEVLEDILRTGTYRPDMVSVCRDLFL